MYTATTFIDNFILLYDHLIQNGHNAMHKAAEGGQLGMLKFFASLFGARVHEKDNYAYTVLHWAALYGHCQVARYLIDELQMDPQDRDKVCGVPGDCAGFKVQGLHVCMV